MAGLSRRAFLATVAGLSAAWALPREALGRSLSSPLVRGEGPTTVGQTILVGSVRTGSYRVLRTGPGEPYYPRLDLTGEIPDPARAQRRRSLAYVGHLTDMHIIDAQSPARFEPMIAQDHALWAGAFRPQDTLTTHVGASVVRSIADVRVSPVTGAPMAAAFVTGDSADMLSRLETRWYIDLLDGVPVTADSGVAAQYDGVQSWPQAYYAYHPEDPTGDWFGAYGFPAVLGMLAAAVGQSVDSGGLPVPWYAVYGNHDTLLLGTLGVPFGLRELAVGGRKYWDWSPLAMDYLQSWTADASALTRMVHAATSVLGLSYGQRAVAADPARALLEPGEFMAAHFDTTPYPGPVGHGFTEEGMAAGRTYWTVDVGPAVRAFGLDTCNAVAGPDGAVPRAQFDWLEAELGRAQAERRLALVFSHHNSLTLENDAALATDPQDLVHAEEFVSMLLRYPCAVAWVNGHSHINTVVAHPRRADDGPPGGLWEITTASCVDFPQQQRVIEVVDNRDGTVSIFGTAIDHAAPAAWTGDLSPEGLASLSREFSANDWVETPSMRPGSLLDRNVELLMPAPFDLSTLTDAQLEAAHAADRARLAAWEAGWPA